MRSARFAEKAAAWDIASIKVDGNDFDAVYAAISTGIVRAREGGGPTVVEADTMRMLGHAIHDGAEYVPAELLAAWEKRDPVMLLRRQLLDYDVARPEDLDAIDHTARTKIQQAVAVAEAAPMPEAATLYDGVYA